MSDRMWIVLMALCIGVVTGLDVLAYARKGVRRDWVRDTPRNGGWNLPMIIVFLLALSLFTGLAGDWSASFRVFGWLSVIFLQISLYFLLLAQTSASSFGTADLKIPFYGLFGACSTMGESLSLGSMCIDGGYGKYILCATSSHFASAEKEFRFPLGYGNQRPLSATWTVTGAGACILGYEPPPRPDNKTLNTLRNRNICAVITGITTGRLIDFGFRDSLNMGACMAPAACDTIARNLQDFHRKPSDYDAIFTGDLGIVGQTILFDLLTEKGFDISSVHQDCGMLIYDPQTQDTHSGGSGCGCAASVLAGYILPGIIQKKWKNILLLII